MLYLKIRLLWLNTLCMINNTFVSLRIQTSIETYTLKKIVISYPFFYLLLFFIRFHLLHHELKNKKKHTDLPSLAGVFVFNYLMQGYERSTFQILVLVYLFLFLQLEETHC